MLHSREQNVFHFFFKSFLEMKIAILGKNLSYALQSTWNSWINYVHLVSVKGLNVWVTLKI